MDPPSLINTGFLPNPVSMALSAASIAGVFLGTRTGSAPWRVVILTLTPAGQLSVTNSLKQPVYFLGSLVWYQPHAHLCPRPCRNYRLCAFAGETAPQSVDIECGPGGPALEQRVPRLTGKFGNPQVILQGLQIEGKRGHFLPFPIFHGKDVVIETRNGHCSIGIFEFREYIHQHLGGILDYAAE